MAIAEAPARSGHQRMRVWQNADELDLFVQQRILPRIPRTAFKLREQIDSASDSIGANFVEGYYSGSLAEYLRFLRYGKRSLGELGERVRRSVRKGYVSAADFEACDDLVIRTMYLFDRLIRALRLKQHEAS